MRTEAALRREVRGEVVDGAVQIHDTHGRARSAAQRGAR
jgi:hypothetical protein